MCVLSFRSFFIYLDNEVLNCRIGQLSMGWINIWNNRVPSYTEWSIYQVYHQHIVTLCMWLFVFTIPRQCWSNVLRTIVLKLNHTHTHHLTDQIYMDKFLMQFLCLNELQMQQLQSSPVWTFLTVYVWTYNTCSIIR